MTDNPDIWRTGNRIPLHVYETTGNQRPVATFFRPEDAALAVKAVNGAFYDPTERDKAQYVSEQLTAVHRVLHDGFPDVVDSIDPVKMALDVVQHARDLRAELDNARTTIRDLELERERVSVAASGVTDASAAAADMWRQTAATNKKLADEWMASAMREIQENATVRRDLQALRDQVAAASTMPSDLPNVVRVDVIDQVNMNGNATPYYRVELDDAYTTDLSDSTHARRMIAAGLAVLEGEASLSAAEAAKPDPVEELARVLHETATGESWSNATGGDRTDYRDLARAAIAWTEKRDA